MAGRVERRINDKFYFVLDEVGGSSDVESDAQSENELKMQKGTPNEEGVSIAEEMKKHLNRETDQTEEKNMNQNEQLKIQHESVPENNLSIERAGETLVNDAKDLSHQRTRLESSLLPDNDEIVLQPEPRTNIGNASRDHDVDMDTKVDMDMDLDSDSGLNEPDGREKVPNLAPLLTITFRDRTAESLHKTSLIKYLAQKIHPCTVVTNSENSLEIEIYEKEPEKIVQEDVLDFTVDTTPEYNSRNSRIPYYAKTGNTVLSDQVVEKDDPARRASTLLCFNCSGSHNMKNCPKPRDNIAINRNRTKFLKTSKNMKTSRYHLDESQRYGRFQPGEMSKNLRNALNLHHDQLPLFLYRMRTLGYPPGWLEEARVSHSGVALYDSKGAAVLEEDEEEGEIVAEGAKDRFDITKIIEFPGFNTPVPKNFVDEGKNYFCPPISEEQSKEQMIRLLEPNAVQAYKKRSLSTGKFSADEPSTPTSTAKKPPSPTIEEMEEKKRQLILALKDEDTTSDTKLSQEDTCSSSQGTESDSLPQPKAKELGTIKNLDFGTPILKSSCPFSKLPNREKFSVNVSDVINFENLPNSTGKYDTMTHLITKIRHTVSKIQNE